MSYLYIRRILLIVFLSVITAISYNGQASPLQGPKNPEKHLFGKKGSKRSSQKIREPRKVEKAKRKQEAKEKKMKKEYEDYVRESKQRAYDIQSPEVKERMKQNERDISYRDKEKKKREKSGNRKAQKKYK